MIVRRRWLVLGVLLGACAANDGVAVDEVVTPQAVPDAPESVPDIVSDAEELSSDAPADVSPTDTGPVDAGPEDAGPLEPEIVEPPTELPPTPEEVVSPPPVACPGAYLPPEIPASLDSAELVEASGLVASHQHAGLLWSHNDSGDVARVIAIGTDGVLQGVAQLTGVDAIDFEDMDLAPCPGGQGHCLWVGDIGDNQAKRESVVVHVLEEPGVAALSPSAPLPVAPLGSISFTYDGGPVDAEALAVAPDASQIWVIEKYGDPKVRLFGATPDTDPDSVQELKVLATFAPPGVDIPMGRLITAADRHPLEPRLLVRVYTGTFEYRFTEPLDVSTLATLEPVLVSLGPLTEPQGEAVTYAQDGLAIWTLSEDPSGAGKQPLHYYGCDDGEAP